MISLQQYTPSVYYNHSRDFQFIGRLYDIVLNSIKTNSELIYNIPLSDNMVDSLLDLTAYTFGLQQKHNYNSKQLKAICKVFPLLIRNKGSLQAIELACQALIHSENLYDDPLVMMSEDNLTINIYLPQEINDISLLQDILTYILPAGVACNIRKISYDQTAAQTKLKMASTIYHYTKLDKDVAKIPPVTLDGFTDARIKDTAGVMMNSPIIRPKYDKETTD